jgi:proteasome accessory factor B
VLAEEVSMAQRRTERLLNLVICLLSTRRYLTKEEIRASVEGYSEGQDAFERAFERDKEELRELGIPLEIGSNDPLFDDEIGYRIRRDAYELPPIALDADEIAVLGLAARFWQRVTLADASSRALVKLKSTATEPAAELVGIEPLVVRDERGFDVLWDAVNDRRVVEFDYRTRDGSTSRRTLEPWGLVSWHGRWYVVGHDRGRDAERVFRLGRVQGEITPVGKPGAFDPPQNLDLRAAVREFEGPMPDRGTAELLVRAGSGVGLRRRATPAPADGVAPTGWDRLLVPYRDDYALAEEVLGYGADVVVVAPAEVRRLVRERLAAVAAAHPADAAAAR